MGESYTGAQRAFCVKEVYKNRNTYEVVPGLYRNHYGLPDFSLCPSVDLIKTWVENFEGTGSTFLRPTGPLAATGVQWREVGRNRKMVVTKSKGDLHPAIDGCDIKVEPVFDFEETQDTAEAPQDMIEVNAEIKQEYTHLEVTPDIVVGSTVYES